MAKSYSKKVKAKVTPVDKLAENKPLSNKEKRQLKKLQKEVESEEVPEAEVSQEEEDDESDIEAIESRLDLDILANSDESDDDENDEDEASVSEDDDEEVEEGEDEEIEEIEEEEEEDEEDIPLSDVEVDSDADVVPHTKLTINNTAALKESLSRIQLPWAKTQFDEHLSIDSTTPVEPQIKDIYDDTERELAFFKQGLDAALQARTKLQKLKLPFSRPMDYFAEMVKSDEHMEKLKAKLVTEASEKKAIEEARKQRQLKKFGKQVQHATLQDRQKEKRDTLDKFKSLKRKRQNNEIDQDEFSIAVEEAAAAKDEHADRNRGKSSRRVAKDKKFGFGGQKRFKRVNDKESSADVSGFNAKKMKGNSKARPGKSKRSRRH
ncbi:unnamed protein product [Kuraishia capsulata CBS 1993]|uniref:Uncharacterized protein n=1 Tax=Kuraishia capsulata CBS 1993 TaxID=1382522 RepID=W6MHT3_9ASCO|nr:uncharacterized protein KUCA_T00001541001 [Kuraishia capsulata CBS 1993]CDK25571.1 unnamed protein product [Kuraishia capsulata CBS 1993]